MASRAGTKISAKIRILVYGRCVLDLLSTSYCDSGDVCMAASNLELIHG